MTRFFFRRGIPLTLSVFAAMIVAAVVLAGTLIVYGYRSNARAALAAADQLMAEVSKTVLERVSALERPLGAIADAAPTWNGIGTKPNFLHHPAEPLMERLLESYPQLTAIYLGFQDGDFFQVYSLTQERNAMRAAVGAPPGASFATRLILRRPDEHRVQIWKYLDADRRIVGSRFDHEVAYDPRERPWFQLAMGSDDLIRTDPYAFASTRDVGMTVARRFDGPVPGVLGVDLALSGLSQFLREQQPTEAGLTILFRVDGTVIAYPDKGRLVRSESEDGGVTLAHVDELSDPRATALFRSFRDHGGALPEVIEVAGQPYVGRVESMPLRTGSNELLGMLVPVEAFTGPIAAIGRRSAIVSALILLASLPLIWLASRLISRPLLRLVSEAEEIRAFRLEQPVELCSPIQEVRLLAESMGRMKAGLRTFGLYVPKALVRQLIESNTEPALGGQRLAITVLFTDVARFTDMAEETEPEELMRRLSVYFEELTDVLMANGATIDKYMGDAIMAFWNAPVEEPDHVVRACRAALLTRAANAALNRRWAAEGQEVMETRLGLHTGEAVVGNVGSSDRMNYTAIGATVNLAARLEGLNKAYGTWILVTEAVASRAASRFLLRTVDKVAPKGIAQPTRIYELRGALTTEPDLPAPLYADDRERAWCARWELAYEAYLARAWDDALDAFRTLAGEMPRDPAVPLYVERTARHKAAPPGPEWTGVEVYLTK
jgi:adenylate cyclase